MSLSTVSDELFLYPTPAGAYYAVSVPEQNLARQFLISLLQQKQTPVLSIEVLKTLMMIDNDHQVLQLLMHYQRMGWVQSVNTVISVPQGKLEQLLPNLLAKLSKYGKALLADDQGLYLVGSGFSSTEAEELSAISAHFANLHFRHGNVLLHHAGVSCHGFAVVDSVGHSQIGFWPLYIGQHRFVMAIVGQPYFNKMEFVILVWTLLSRYLKN